MSNSISNNSIPTLLQLTEWLREPMDADEYLEGVILRNRLRMARFVLQSEELHEEYEADFNDQEGLSTESI